ncbi:flagellar protein FlaG [Dechloromonas denitrificans]|jgi:flagellar protein FlaG|uniref:flagellar protein FlaG n=1 Tax=Dechloromonas denitrificans TaxID=281362 RepID=UPI001CF7EE7E|nr:flagellar protein FlaG [Dechloromonas denitrificans]UCV04571.1 flagellar protein FlaG [Dechloromonas denitrificans]UCV08900.1 flagellar protein FlaG [Dechloromonas denitrificans]
MNVQPLVSSDVSPANTAAQKQVRAAPRAENQSSASVAENKDVGVNSQSTSDASSVKEAVARIADFVAQTSSEISFSIDEKTGLNVVKVIDSSTNDVIRQFPSEEVIAIAQALDKLQGLFLRDKV